VHDAGTGHRLPRRWNRVLRFPLVLWVVRVPLGTTALRIVPSGMGSAGSGPFRGIWLGVAGADGSFRVRPRRGMGHAHALRGANALGYRFSIAKSSGGGEGVQAFEMSRQLRSGCHRY
jgi:hypothetical protein